MRVETLHCPFPKPPPPKPNPKRYLIEIQRVNPMDKTATIVYKTGEIEDLNLQARGQGWYLGRGFSPGFGAQARGQVRGDRIGIDGLA